MFSRDRWLEIFDSIKKNKLRTFLSGFTVALGILIFVVLFGFGNGLDNTFDKFFKDDALNTMWLRSGRTSKAYMGYKANRRIEFDNKDLEDITSRFSFYIDGITPRMSESGNVGYKLKSNNYSIRGVAPSHQKK
jgi:putative ABC transport system permease protein